MTYKKRDKGNWNQGNAWLTWIMVDGRNWEKAWLVAKPWREYNVIENYMDMRR